MAKVIRTFHKWFNELSEEDKMELSSYFYGTILDVIGKNDKKNLLKLSEGLNSGPATMTPLMKGLFSGTAGSPSRVCRHCGRSC